MTKEEASRNYQIPIEILEEYESWGLGGSVRQATGHEQYGDQDLECLSLIMALHGIGLSASEVEAYMRLTLEDRGTEQQRMNMLNELRDRKLDEIHLKEKQVERLDFLRHGLRRQGAKG